MCFYWRPWLWQRGKCCLLLVILQVAERYKFSNFWYDVKVLITLLFVLFALLLSCLLSVLKCYFFYSYNFSFFILLFSFFFLFCLFDQITARLPGHHAYQREYCAMATVSMPPISPPPTLSLSAAVWCVLCPKCMKWRLNGKAVCECPRVWCLKAEIGFRLNFVLGVSTLTLCQTSLMFVCICLSIWPERIYRKKSVTWNTGLIKM